MKKNFIFNANIATEFGTLIHETEEAIAKALQTGDSVNYIDLKNNFILKSRALALKYPVEYFARDKSGQTYQEKTEKSSIFLLLHQPAYIQLYKIPPLSLQIMVLQLKLLVKQNLQLAKTNHLLYLYIL